MFDQPVVRTSIKSTINLWNSTIVLKFYNCMMVAYRVGGGEGEEGLVVSKDSWTTVFSKKPYNLW